MRSDDKRAIAARARTIYERADSLRRTTGSARTTDRSAAPGSVRRDALAAWARAFAPANPEALTRRLAWDDLTPTLVLDALDAAADEPAPAWTDWMDRFADAAGASADGAEAAVPNEIPYAEV